MAYRRRYKTGGVVSEPVSVDVSLPAEEPAPPPAADDGDEAVLRAFQGSHRAEQLQRQAAQQPPTVGQVIDHIPGLTEHKRQFLRDNPIFVTSPPHAQAMSRHYQAALQRGIADDTPEMNAAVLDGVRHEIERQRQSQHHVAELKQAREEAKREADQAAALARIDRELAASSGNAPAPQAAPLAPSPAPRPLLPEIKPPLPEIKRTMPITAPVSREVPTGSGQRQSASTRIMLTAEERFIARNSFSAPDMSDEEKERSYATQKLRLQKMLASGEYTDGRHQR